MTPCQWCLFLCFLLCRHGFMDGCFLGPFSFSSERCVRIHFTFLYCLLDSYPFHLPLMSVYSLCWDDIFFFFGLLFEVFPSMVLTAPGSISSISQTARMPLRVCPTSPRETTLQDPLPQSQVSAKACIVLCISTVQCHSGFASVSTMPPIPRIRHFKVIPLSMVQWF